MIVSSSGNSSRCAAMKASSATVMSCLTGMGRYTGAARKVLLPGLIGVAHEIGVEGWIVIHQQLAVAIENAAAGSRNGFGANAVVLRQQRVFAGLQNLKLPESEDQAQEGERDKIFGADKSHGRELVFAIED